MNKIGVILVGALATFGSMTAKAAKTNNQELTRFLEKNISLKTLEKDAYTPMAHFLDNTEFAQTTSKTAKKATVKHHSQTNSNVFINNRINIINDAVVEVEDSQKVANKKIKVTNKENDQKATVIINGKKIPVNGNGVVIENSTINNQNVTIVNGKVVNTNETKSTKAQPKVKIEKETDGKKDATITVSNGEQKTTYKVSKNSNLNIKSAKGNCNVTIKGDISNSNVTVTN